MLKTNHTGKRRCLLRALVPCGAVVAAAATIGGSARAGEETQYRYDVQGQVVLVTKSDGRQAGYGYDNAGNRVAVAGGARVLPTYPDRLLPGQSLLPGKTLKSANNLYTLAFQDDGNIVVYGQNWIVRWQSATSWGKTPAHLTMQNDGNVVAYGPVSQVNWQTGTGGNPGAGLVLQDDGNLVVYSSSGAALWHIYQ